MRLNGWKRIGIVLSALWVVGISIKLHDDGGVWAVKNAKVLYDSCMSHAVVQQDFDKCWNDQISDVSKFKSDYFLTNPDFWLGFILYFVAPIMMGWLFVYICIWIFRWIKAGFKKSG